MFERIGTALAVILGTVVFVFLFLIALGTCIENIDNEAKTTVATQTPITSPTASIVPTVDSKIWTIEELADCDTTTLSAQLRNMQNPNDPKYAWAKDSRMSDCEVEILNGWTRMYFATEKRLQQGDTKIQEILDMNSAVKEAVRQTTEDKILDKSELEYECYAMPRWAKQYAGAKAYIDSIKEDNEWQSLEIDILLFERTYATAKELCE